MKPQAQPSAFSSPFTEGHTIFRLSGLFVLGVVIAMLLTWVMYILIQFGEQRLDETRRVQILDFVRVKRDEVSRRTEQRAERPKADQPPPAPEAPPSDAEGSDAVLAVSAMPVVADLDIQAGGFSLGSSEGEYLPIVKVAPVYPPTAASRGLEGFCTVEYTVTINGATRDISVVEGQCSDAVFRRPSVMAAERFKYKPRVINGEPVEVHGVRNRFVYSLEGGGKGEGR